MLLSPQQAVTVPPLDQRFSELARRMYCKTADLRCKDADVHTCLCRSTPSAGGLGDFPLAVTPPCVLLGLLGSVRILRRPTVP